MNQVLQQSVSPTILTVVRGFSKVFVGELVEKGQSSVLSSAGIFRERPPLTPSLRSAMWIAAREVAKHDGPLTPEDLREAYRLYLVDHEGAGGTRKKMFVR